jgi:predicted DNA-binding antitoxin AbrB/MazE fold protein
MGIMTETIECIFTGSVLKPVEPLHLKDGERVIVHIERKIPFDTIKVKLPVNREYVRSMRDESWMPL